MTTLIDSPWWTAHKDNREAHDTLIGLMNHYRQNQATRLDNTRKLISAFEWGYKASSYSAQTSDPALKEEMLCFNSAQNVVETVQCKVSKTRILPMPLTSGGSYLERQRAKDLGKAIEGEFDENDVDRIKEEVILDALVTAHGAGAAKVYFQHGRIKIEHVPIEGLFVDDLEGRLKSPRTLIQRHYIDRYVALEMYGGDDAWLAGTKDERRRKILTIAAATVEGMPQSQHDLIEIVEAWHLPSKPLETDDDGNIKEHDGRWAVCIDGCTLADLPWNKDKFPFAFYVPRRRRRSFWGMSLMQNLAAGQFEFEKLTQKLQAAHHRMGGSHLYINRASNINCRELDNDVGTIIEGDGATPPVELNPAPVNPQTYQYRSSIVEEMMRFSGVSSLSAGSQLPAGLSQASGKALQVFEDFEAERLLIYHRALERWVLAISDLIIDEAADAVARGEDYTVRFRGKRALEKVKWKDVLIDRENFILKVFPVSMLAKTPAAKFAQLQDLLNAGAITVDQFKRLFEIPDIESENEIDGADTDIIDRNLDIMVTKGRYMTPEPFDNLELSVKRAAKFYNVCRANDVPDDRLELVRNYIADAQALLEQAAPPPAPAPMPGAPPPMPPPMPGAPPMM